MAKNKRVMDMKELASVITDVMGQRYRQMEKAFGNIEQPMMRAFRVGTEPMVNDIRAFMAQHKRSGDTIASFNPGVVLFDPTADMYYFKFGFDFNKGGFPALILEYGDSGSPMRQPNKAYYFMHWSKKNHVDGVFDAMQKELSKLLDEV